MGKLNGQRYHFLYRTTNLINKKFYVGVHSTYNLLDGYLGSGKKLTRAVKKYGKENFKCEVLEFFESREKVLLKEKEIVNEQLLNDLLCMNLTIGGNGGFSKEACKKAAEKHEWLRENDKKWFDNFKKKISNGTKKTYENGRISISQTWWNGKKHSNQTKEKMSERAKLRIGEKSNQFGTCWINNGKEAKKIKKEDLQNWLNNNWKKGRKLEAYSNGKEDGLLNR